MPETILRIPEVKTRLGLSRAAIYERLNPRSRRHDPAFPLPVRLGGNSIGFLESEIEGYIARLAERRGESAA